MTSQYAIDTTWIDAVDVGTSSTKIASDYINLGQFGSVKISSVSAPISGNTGTDANAPERTEVVMMEGDSEWQVFGPRINTLADTSQMKSYNNETRYWSEWYLRFVGLSLIWGAMNREYSKEPASPRILLSIPAAVYANPEKLEAVKANLYGTNGVRTFYAAPEKVGGKPVKYRFIFDTSKEGNVIIRPEGAGSYYRRLVEEIDYRDHQTLLPSGHQPITNFRDQRVLMLAWGWLTCSMIGFDHGTPIKGLGRSNVYVGISNLGLRMTPYLGLSMEPPPQLLNEWITSPGDTISVNGKKFRGMEAIRRKLAIEIANEGINWAMTQKVNARLDFDVAAVTGGTAEFLFGGPNPRVHMEDLTSRDSIPGGELLLAEEAPTDDATGLYMQQDAKRRYGV